MPVELGSTPSHGLGGPPSQATHDVLVRNAPTQNCPGLTLVVPVQVAGKTAAAVIDTEAQISILKRSFFDTLGWTGDQIPVKMQGFTPDVVEGIMVREVPINLGGGKNTSGIYMWPKLQMNFCWGWIFWPAIGLTQLSQKSAQH